MRRGLRHGSRAIAAGALLAAVLATMARAGDPAPLPPVTVSPPPPLPPKSPVVNNPDKGAGGAANDNPSDGKALERLNQELRRKVDEVYPGNNTPPLDARSPDTKIGVVNIPGVQEQYGQNFGRSAVPYRPPPLIYNTPVGRH